MEFRKAVHVDLPRIVEIYNQIIPSRLATADLEPSPWPTVKPGLPRLRPPIRCG